MNSAFHFPEKEKNNGQKVTLYSERKESDQVDIGVVNQLKEMGYTIWHRIGSFAEMDLPSTPPTLYIDARWISGEEAIREFLAQKLESRRLREGRGSKSLLERKSDGGSW